MKTIVLLSAAAAAFVLTSIASVPAEARGRTYYNSHGHKSGSVRYSHGGGSVYGRNGHKIGSFRSSH
jgi:hypothetical protein